MISKTCKERKRAQENKDKLKNFLNNDVVEEKIRKITEEEEKRRQIKINGKPTNKQE